MPDVYYTYYNNNNNRIIIIIYYIFNGETLSSGSGARDPGNLCLVADIWKYSSQGNTTLLYIR